MKTGLSYEAAKTHPFFKRKLLMFPIDYFRNLLEQGLEQNLITKDEIKKNLNAFEELELPLEAQISAMEMIVIARATETRNKWYWEGINERANNKDNPINIALNATNKTKERGR